MIILIIRINDNDDQYLFSNNTGKSWSQKSTRQGFFKKTPHKQIHIRHISDWDGDYFAGINEINMKIIMTANTREIEIF